MFGIGLPEMILILALALIVVGPDKLPDLARSLAKGVMELKKTAEGLKDQIQADGNPLDDLKPDLEDAAKTFKSHMLDHPEKGTSDLFAKDDTDSQGSNAAKAYEELKKAGIDPADVPTDNTGGPPSVHSFDNLTEVVSDSEQESAETAPSDSGDSQTAVDKSKPDETGNSSMSS